jgi:hypothetical protein
VESPFSPVYFIFLRVLAYFRQVLNDLLDVDDSAFRTEQEVELFGVPDLLEVDGDLQGLHF